MAELSKRQREFAAAYARTGSVQDAAMMASYSISRARQLMRDERVQAYLAEATEGDDPRIADRSERLRFLTAIMRGRDPYGGDDGTEEVARFFAPKDRIRAAELLCRVAGDFRDVQEHSTTQINVMLSEGDRERARRLVSGRRDVTQEEDTIDAEFDEG
jgi:phage terminase small subunit